MRVFFKKIRKSRPFYLTISMLLYFVLADEFADTFLVRATSKILANNTWMHEYSLIYFLLSLQIIFSSLQSGFSDYYLRRKSMIVSMLATMISIFLLKFAVGPYVWILIVSVVIKGILGNTLPIAWSGISDETKGRGTRFFLALSIYALAVGSWGALIGVPHLTNKFLHWSVMIILMLGIMLAFYYSDPEDTPTSTQENDKQVEPETIKNMSFLSLFSKECSGLYRIGRKTLNFLCLNAFLFSEISFYQILFRIEVFETYECFVHVPLAIGVGYTIGTIILKFIDPIKDRIVSAVGIVISIITILITSVLFAFGNTDQIIFIILFAFYSLGFSWFTPALFSIIMTKEPLHNQGKGYGLIESTDSLASLITFMFLFKTSKISCTHSLTISCTLITISGIIFMFAFIKDKNYCNL